MFSMLLKTGWNKLFSEVNKNFQTKKKSRQRKFLFLFKLYTIIKLILFNIYVVIEMKLQFSFE